MRRQYLSGFMGSAGTALILPDRALMWTDGRSHYFYYNYNYNHYIYNRYFLQASIELSG